MARKPTTPTLSPYKFDRARADRAVGFFNDLLRHSKGQWAGQSFKLEPWEAKPIAEIFGTIRRSDGRRRYRRTLWFMPRKNGKSTIGAGIANLLTFADSEPGAEVYSAAGDREQAAIIFNEAKSMVVQAPLLMERAQLMRRAIVVADTMSSYRVISAEAKTKHGLNAHGVVFDELHTQDNRELFDVLTTSTGARRQPLTAMFTTAGFDKDTICYEQYEYAKRVARGEVDDPEFYPLVFEADPEDDWTDPKTWAKANPNLGITVSLDYLAAECRRGMEVPAYENTFRRLHLNQWTQQDVRWVSVDRWDENSAPLKPLANRKCYVGMDLSRKTDLTAAVAVFADEEGGFDVLPKFWMPKDRIAEKELADKVPYSAWVRDGLIEATEGNVIDYRSVKTGVMGWGRLYSIAELAYDPWSATQIAVELADEGLTVVEHMQGFKSMSEPTKKLEELLLAKRLRHGGHPVLRWMFSNVAIEMDAAENIKPSKRKAKGRIDGVVALIMALGRATLSPAVGKSVYEKRGLRTL